MVPFENKSDSESESEDGPLPEGQERAGAHWRKYKDLVPQREEWMTVAHPSMAAAFDQSVEKKDPYAVRRSDEELAEMQKQIDKKKGKSLMEEFAEGKFDATKDDGAAIRKRLREAGDVWGQSANSKVAKPFDPSTDLEIRRDANPEEVKSFMARATGWSDKFASSKNFL